MNAAPHFALGLLQVEGRYLLQLRDDRPGIADPGVWALFGGQLEPGERPEAAFHREVAEELGIDVPDARFLWRHDATDGRVFWLFEAELGERWPQARLGEGQRMACFRAEDLEPLPLAPLARAFLFRHMAGAMS